MTKRRTGLFITIEGIDGAGKTSLVEGLKTTLSDLNPIFTREPGTAWLGEAVRRGIKEEIDPIAEAFLFAADHAEHISEVIRPELDAGHLIISDRYFDSRYAYQTETLKEIMPNPMKWLMDMHKGWTVIPDITFLLVLPPKSAMERIQSDRTETEHFEKLNTLKNVQENYLKLAESEPERFVLIDAGKDKDEILEFISGEIRKAASGQ